jgi:hypothetical protein
MTDIRNTSADMRDPLHAEMFLLQSLADGDQGSNAILRQEAEGQRQLVTSDKLPTDMGGQQAEFEAAGFTFGDVVEGDGLFRRATLPAGWSRQPSDHSMWSYLVDQHGRRRVGVFYKAAFYDRSAHMSLETPASYLRTLLHDGGQPVLDDEWLTPAVATETLASLRHATQQQIDECADLLERTGNTYWTDRAKDHREALAKIDAMVAALPAPVPPESEVSA